MNNTKIRYTVIAGLLYEIKHISFYNMEIIARPCDKKVSDIPEEELFTIDDLHADFKIRIEN